jgi:cobalt-zinc-cadmium efflux system membrane fusion protein
MKTFQAIAMAGLIAVTVAIILWFSSGERDMPERTSADEASAEGPQGGRLLAQDGFALEITIFETGIPAEFHLFAYNNGSALAPGDFEATIELTRLGGDIDSFTFAEESNYLHSLEPVREPHSFDVSVTARHGGREYRWQYEGHEGRTEIPRRIADAQGIETEAAGPAVIERQVELVGTVQSDPGRISQVRVRFPGVVTSIDHTIGDIVERGSRLGQIETNESLRRVDITAPISGLIIDRSLQVGQASGDSPLFVIADLSEVWVQLDVFGTDLAQIETGQPVRITTLDGREIADAIDWVSPLVAHGSQSVQARVRLANPDNSLRPGQFVRGRVRVAADDVALAVKRSGLQTFRDFDVVYAQVGDVYEVRMLELGRVDGDFAEVLAGLAPGEVYVSGNSYLVKADIEKAGASHDH